MIDDIKKLLYIIEQKNNDKSVIYNCKEEVILITNLIEQRELNDKLTYDLLVELYKYIIFSNIHFTVDPRVEEDLRRSYILSVKNAIENKNLTEEQIKNLKDLNEKCLSYILDPLKLKREYDEFYKKNPDAIF